MEMHRERETEMETDTERETERQSEREMGTDRDRWTDGAHMHTCVVRACTPSR